MLVALVVLALGQGGIPSTDMPLSTPPVMPIRAINKRNLISISKVETGKDGQVAFLFRYSFRGEITPFLDTLKQELVAGQGWTHEADPSGSKQFYFYRKLSHPKVVRQVITVQPYRFLRDETSPSKTRVSNQEKGWVCVNYDEIRKGK